MIHNIMIVQQIASAHSLTCQALCMQSSNRNQRAELREKHQYFVRRARNLLDLEQRTRTQLQAGKLRLRSTFVDPGVLSPQHATYEAAFGILEHELCAPDGHAHCCSI